MQRPGQVLGDVDAKIFETVHPLHQGPIDFKVVVVPFLLIPKVHYQLLSFADFQVGLYIVISDQAHHICVVSKHTMVFESKVAAQSCVYKEYSSGLKTQL